MGSRNLTWVCWLAVFGVFWVVVSGCSSTSDDEAAVGSEETAQVSEEENDDLSDQDLSEENAESEEVAETGMDLPDYGVFEPLFKEPEPIEREVVVARMVGIDTALLPNLLVDTRAAKSRVRRMKKLEADARKQMKAKRMIPYLAYRQQILEAYKEHVAYLEFLMASGLRDPAVADPPVLASRLYGLIIKSTKLLRSQQSSSPKYLQWTADEIIARIRVGDGGVREEAQVFIKKNGMSPLAMRVRMVAVAEDVIQSLFNGEFGSPADLLGQPQAPLPRGALLYVAGQRAEADGNSSLALTRYLEGMSQLVRLVGPDKKPAPLVDLATKKMIQLALVAKVGVVDGRLKEFLERSGLSDHMRFYFEQAALGTRAESPRNAVGMYGVLEKLPKTDVKVRMRIRARMLDIALAAADAPVLVDMWRSLGELRKQVPVKGLGMRAAATQQILLTAASEKPSRETIMAFVDMHDLLWAEIPGYRASENWSLEVINVLMAAKQYALVIDRAEKSYSQVKDPGTRVQIVEAFLRSAESLLGISPEPDWEKPTALSPAKYLVVKRYMAMLDSLEKTSESSVQKEMAAYQTSYMAYISGQIPDATKRFEHAVTAYPESGMAPRAALFFVKGAFTRRDFGAVEKLAKFVLQSFGGSAKDVPPEIQQMIQTSYWEEGKKAVATKKLDVAIEKFSLCISEMPDAPRRGECLNERAQILVKQGKKREAMADLEQLAKGSAGGSVSEDALWRAAELAESIDDFGRAAVFFVRYARTFPAKVVARRAWLRAGNAYKKTEGSEAASYAATAYRQHLKVASDPAEKLLVQKELAQMALARNLWKQAHKLASDALSELKANPGAGKPDDGIFLREILLQVYQANADNAAVRKTCQEMLGLKSSTKEGSLALVRMRRIYGAQLASAVDAGLVNGTGFESILQAYDEAKKHLRVECSIPKSTWCASSIFRIAELASNIGSAYGHLTKDEQNRVPPLARSRISGLQMQVKMYLNEAATYLQKNGSEEPGLRERISDLRSAQK